MPPPTLLCPQWSTKAFFLLVFEHFDLRCSRFIYFGLSVFRTKCCINVPPSQSEFCDMIHFSIAREITS